VRPRLTVDDFGAITGILQKFSHLGLGNALDDVFGAGRLRGDQ
jgi:hypothetical protein